MAKLPSLEVITERVRAERAAQLRHFNGLDTKAGIVIGFSGVLVAIGAAQGIAVRVGQFIAAIAALAALFAFLPRAHPTLNVRNLRERYLRSESQFTNVHLLDTEVAMVEEASELLRRKAMYLKIAALMLATATAIRAMDVLVR